MLVAGGRSMRYSTHKAGFVSNDPRVAQDQSNLPGVHMIHAWVAVGNDWSVDATTGTGARNPIALIDRQDGINTLPEVWPFPDVTVTRQMQTQVKRHFALEKHRTRIGILYRRDPALTDFARKLFEQERHTVPIGPIKAVALNAIRAKTEGVLV